MSHTNRSPSLCRVVQLSLSLHCPSIGIHPPFKACRGRKSRYQLRKGNFDRFQPSALSKLQKNLTNFGGEHHTVFDRKWQFLGTFTTS